MQSLIISDANEVLSFTGEPIENAQRWVDIKETRVFFVFDAETPETIEIKEITIIDPGGEVFNAEKADLSSIKDDFSLELGYCFTLPDFTRKGFSSSIVNLLLDEFKV